MCSFGEDWEEEYEQYDHDYADLVADVTQMVGGYDEIRRLYEKLDEAYLSKFIEFAKRIKEFCPAEQDVRIRVSSEDWTGSFDVSVECWERIKNNAVALALFDELSRLVAEYARVFLYDDPFCDRLVLVHVPVKLVVEVE